MHTVHKSKEFEFTKKTVQYIHIWIGRVSFLVQQNKNKKKKTLADFTSSKSFLRPQAVVN